MSAPHVLAIPYPAQGHVIPLMELSQNLVNHGYKVTFVNTDYLQERIVKSFAEKNEVRDRIRLVAIPDGLEAWEDRNDLGKLTGAILRVMPNKLEELILKINGTDDDKISCVIADGVMCWALDVAEKMGIKRAAFWPASAAAMVLSISIPKSDEGITDDEGMPIKDQKFQLSPNIPAVSTSDPPWTRPQDTIAHRTLFMYMKKKFESITLAEWSICNSSYDLEPEAFTLSKTLLPVGPLLASNRQGSSAGHFWPTDSTCLQWLDQQPRRSVVYVAFGSLTVFDKTQFQELALGLELCNRPFLWVVRPDLITNGANHAYPEGFQERVSTRGLMVSWAPQQKVLSHPSIACFLSHCGWNSTMEGVGNGVPFLCWPYFADQILNQGYICDFWRVGLRLEPDERGIIPRQEIKNKLDQLLVDGKFSARVMELKETTARNIGEGGKSYNNLKNFIEWIKSLTTLC